MEKAKEGTEQIDVGHLDSTFPEVALETQPGRSGQERRMAHPASLQDFVLREAVKAAVSQTMPSMCGDGKQGDPTKAALAVVEAFKAAAKSLISESAV